tara:strand:+ start:692 stop:2059 length:1368 start_codon:yes stop_codon:yes gene_type:complete
MVLGALATGLVKGALSKPKKSKKVKVENQKLLPSSELRVSKKTISTSLIRDLKPVEKEPSEITATKDSSLAEKFEAIKKFLSERYKRDRDESIMKRRRREEEKRKQREENIEKKKKKVPLPFKGFLPRTGIFDTIGNFLLFLAGGILFNKFLSLQKDFSGILNLLKDITVGIWNFTTTVVSGIINIVNAGYEGYDAVMQKVEDVGGKDLREKVEKFMGLLNKVINGAIILGMIGLRSRGIPGLGRNRSGSRSLITRGHDTRRQFGDRFRDRGRRRIQSRTSSSMGRSGGRSMGRSLVTSNLSGAPGKFGRSAFTNMSRKALMQVLGRKGTRVLLSLTRKIISPIVKKIPIIGPLIDFLINFFVFKEPLGKSAFVAAASGIGTLVGGAIGSLIPFGGTLLGGLAGGVIGDVAGRALYDAIFGEQDSPRIEDLDEYDVDERTIDGKVYILKEQVITN